MPQAARAPSQWAAIARRFLRLEAEQLIREHCRDGGEAAYVRPKVQAVVDGFSEEELLELVHEGMVNPNSVHPWARKKAKAELEPLIRQHCEAYRQR
ncbi:MAG TPA: hypothetical protein VIL95_05395 [Bacillota bacterium]